MSTQQKYDPPRDTPQVPCAQYSEGFGSTLVRCERTHLQGASYWWQYASFPYRGQSSYRNTPELSAENEGRSLTRSEKYRPRKVAAPRGDRKPHARTQWCAPLVGICAED